MVRYLILTAVFFFGLPAAHAASNSRFDPFVGKFLRGGKVIVSDDGGLVARGRCRIRFSVTSNGDTARLRITGDLKLRGAARELASQVILRKEGIAGLSNLAPGIDDGYFVEEGSYGAGVRSIRANFPFVFGTAAGTVSVVVRVDRSSRARRLQIIQTLTSNTLTSPITWRFTARGP